MNNSFILTNLNSNKYILTNLKLNVIFKREVNSLSLSPKSPSSPKSTTISKEDISSSSNEDENQENIDAALNFISENNTTKNLALHVKRKSHDTLSNAGPSGENTLSKKAKLLHENDNTSIIDSIELDTSTSGEITTSQISEIASNATIAETASQVATQPVNLTTSMVDYREAMDRAFTLIDDIQSTIALIDAYVDEIHLEVSEIEESIYATVRTDDVPRLMSDDSSSSQSLFFEDSSDSESDDNNSNIGNIPGQDLGTLDNNSNVPGQDVGMEPLDSGIALTDVMYSNNPRSEHIIHNNYSIDMDGIDNMEFRMTYEYLIECLDHLDELIDRHQEMEALERVILPLNSALGIESSPVEVEISAFLEIFSHFN